MLTKIGTAIFGIGFLLVCQTTRVRIAGLVEDGVTRLNAGAPNSYILLVAPVVVALIVLVWPKGKTSDQAQHYSDL